MADTHCYRCSLDLKGRKHCVVTLDGSSTSPDLGKVIMCDKCAPKKKSVKRSGES